MLVYKCNVCLICVIVSALCDMHPMRALFLIPRNPQPKLKTKKWSVLMHTNNKCWQLADSEPVAYALLCLEPPKRVTVVSSSAFESLCKLVSSWAASGSGLERPHRFHGNSTGMETYCGNNATCCPIDETMTVPAVCKMLNCFIHFEHEQIDSANHFYCTVSITIHDPQ